MPVEEFKDESKSDVWQMYFDGAMNQFGTSIGAILLSSNGKQFPAVIKLCFECIKNIAEYEACVTGL